MTSPEGPPKLKNEKKKNSRPNTVRLSRMK